MPDPRFFEDLGPVTLAELASLTGAELADPDQGQPQVRGVAVLASAQADHWCTPLMNSLPASQRCASLGRARPKKRIG